MRTVLASANPGKLEELKRLLAPCEIDLELMSDLGVASPVESGLTFVENALIKARHAARQTGFAAIADDSGLVVPALGGAPGLKSSRYAGAGATAADNNAKLIRALSDVADRRAHFYCALVFLAHAEDPAPIVATGAWHGVIEDDARGSHGFGYDPHFFVAELNATAAELDPDVKNVLSHRAFASRSLVAALNEALIKEALKERS